MRLTVVSASLVACCALTALSGCIAFAAEHSDGDAHAQTFRGMVRSVDYRDGSLVLRSRRNGLITIEASPSTSIVIPDEAGYHGFTDIKPGDEVRIDASDLGTRYEAQVIERLRR